jgi:RimJ/RimL family protein N-acetyltransferase
MSTTSMPPHVRELQPAETDVVIDYFLGATPEHLEMLGVDPSRLPPAETWRKRFAADLSMPPQQRKNFALIWLLGEQPIGFSSCDKIVVGEQANMHLHILHADNRRRGLGVQCVRGSVAIYFERLRLKRLFCEPNAFNVAPNRTLQRAGFTYLKTHMTVPGPLNYHQAVTRWVIEKGADGRDIGEPTGPR